MARDRTGEKNYTFSASVDDKQAPAQVFADIRFHRYDVASLSIRLFLLGDGHARTAVYSQLMHLKRNHFWLYAKTPALQSVEVLGVHGMATEGSTSLVDCVIPSATAVQIGLSEDSVGEQTKFFVSISLTPSGILLQPALFSFGSTGEIKREVYVKGKITVPTSFGDLDAHELFESSRDIEFGNEVANVTRRPVLSGEITVEPGTSLSMAHDKLRDQIGDICTVLGLCYRRTVNYFEIRYLPITEEGLGTEAVFRRSVPLTSLRPAGTEELINYRDLIRGGLKRLHAEFMEAKARHELERALRSLALSYGPAMLEVAYILGYAALESAVGAADNVSTPILTPSQCRKLRRRLSAEILRFLEEEPGKGTEKAATAQMLSEKLSEVRRISIRSRLTKVCKRLGVRVADLWPQSLGFEKGFGRATAARNRLVHAALAGDPTHLYPDLVRLRVLAERIVLKLLKWPDRKIWKWYDQELRWTNKGESEAPLR